MLKKWALIILTLSSINALAQSSDTSTPFNSPDHPIVVSADNPSFTLHLKSNPTTGFFWYLGKHNHYQLVALNHRFIAPKNKKMVGAPGEETWTFGVQKSAFNVPRIFKIHFTYTRPWTTQNATYETFTVITRR